VRLRVSGRFVISFVGMADKRARGYLRCRPFVWQIGRLCRAFISGHQRARCGKTFQLPPPVSRARRSRDITPASGGSSLNHSFGPLGASGQFTLFASIWAITLRKSFFDCTGGIRGQPARRREKSISLSIAGTWSRAAWLGSSQAWIEA